MLGAWLKQVLVTATLLAVTNGAAACAKREAARPQTEGTVPDKTIEAVLQQHTDRLMSVPGVVGTAIGECQGKPCIKVLVVRKTPQVLGRIPPTLEGFPVAVEETGEIRALDST